MSQTKSEHFTTRSEVYSRSTRRSVKSETIAIARAKAESAKIKAHFAAKEAKIKAAFAEKEIKAAAEMQLKLEKLRMETALEELAAEKESAAAAAEADILEELAKPTSERLSNVLERKSVPDDGTERTSEYVRRHAEPGNCPLTAPRAESTPAIHRPYVKQESKPALSQFSAHSAARLSKHYVTVDQIENEERRVKRHSDCISDDRKYPPSSWHNRAPPGYSHNNQGMSDFFKFLARRELLAKGLAKFNDRPESYRAWRSSFRNATRDLELNASEEADLLVNWLGNESSEHARRIRDININYPSRGLSMIWERVDECYGSPEVIENSLFKRIDDFPRIPNKGYQKLRELSDLVTELQIAKAEGDLPGLAFLDTARGVNSIVQKLPYSLQETWISRGSKYKQKHNVPFPPFSYFVDFIRYQAKVKNDPSFDISSSDSAYPRSSKPALTRNFKDAPVAVRKTSVSPTQDPSRECPLHKKPHSLSKCRGFREKTLQDRRTFLKENRLCYRCCASTSHLGKDCKVSINCSECNSSEHNTALHPGPAPWTLTPSPTVDEHGGEQQDTVPPVVTPRCTQVCGEGLSNKSCSKICLVTVYLTGRREKAVKLYVILDDQSNRSLASSAFFDTFKIKEAGSSYLLKTCTGVSEETGRRAIGYQIESFDGQTTLPLPTLIECNQFPTDREEIPTPEVALHHGHLKGIAHLIPELDPQAEIALLLGRDIIRVHKVRKQINGPHNSPYAQKLDLGWVIIGNVCLGSVHKPTSVNSLFTKTLEGGRPSLFQPCTNRFLVREKPASVTHSNPYTANLLCHEDRGHLGCSVFQRTKEDHKIGPSIEDHIFLEIMRQGFYKTNENSWVAPLPFKAQRPRLANNREQALKRFSSLRSNFQRKTEMKEHFFSFMSKMFEDDHAEIAPPLKDNEECWYLPIFGVYHPKKPGKIRVVFDSSSRHQGVSLNDVLLKGPDLNNTLLGVLIRFRKEAVAIVADIQQMFHSFQVKEEHRNFLRFLWFKDNDPTKNITEYRMKVHVFGNSPSPAVAIYGLKLSAQEGEKDVTQFIERDFYVDDGPKSLSSPEAAISLLKRTQSTLASSNLRLHKIASNSKVVMEAFPSQDYASDFKDLDLATDSLPMQRSLGLNWDLKSDTLTFQVDQETKPFTRRGVLSTINSLYDPLGFAAPITIQGKILLRELTADTCDWDSPLPPEKETLWVTWRDSLKTLSNLHIHRPYTHFPPTRIQSTKLCVFCDASVKAIGAVTYLKSIDIEGQVQIGFVMGKAKLAPCPETTIPRLELCAAVLAVELAELITSEMDLELEDTEFYTDSKVVLGYIYNESRRFYVYVHNRVLRIRKSTQPTQWHYVSTDHNPADHATRSVPASRLKDTTWLTGPPFLYKSAPTTPVRETYVLLEPESDSDIRPQVSTLHTTISNQLLGSKRFHKFSTWKSLQRATASKLTHETLTTFMAEVSAVMNARPLTSIPNDPEDPFLLTPSTLLTQKVEAITAPPVNLDTKDLYRCQWKRVQVLADTFWNKWKKQYLSNLQTRNKWQDSKPNLQPGAIVLMKDSQSRRNEWPLGLITQVFPSEDGNVRKAELKVIRQGQPKLFLRPVSELILLLSSRVP
ncbi:uncharacterized protein [Aquarana catesbeiana]|uniref:uncharacterized protein n=1 Tax=Aquarana catesbeiana TaxID=8400 RepID=UPI003CC9D031